MPKTTTPNTVTVGDGGARFAPETNRRLFQFERDASPVGVDNLRGRPPRVILNLPDNGAGRDPGMGPGIYRTGNVTKIIHADGCAFPITRCRGECTTQKVAP